MHSLRHQRTPLSISASIECAVECFLSSFTKENPTHGPFSELFYFLCLVFCLLLKEPGVLYEQMILYEKLCYSTFIKMCMNIYKSRVLFKKNKGQITFVVLPNIFMQTCIVCQIEYKKNRVRDCVIHVHMSCCLLCL